MAKFMIIVPPLTGHINPTVALGQRLIALGHHVIWVGYKESLSASLPKYCERRLLDKEAFSEHSTRRVDQHGAQERRGFAGLHYLWESVLIPLAQGSFTTLERLLSEERPTLCIVDQQMLSGALVCQKWGYPYVSSATTSAALIDALEGLPQIQSWHDQLLAALWSEFNVPRPSYQRLIELSPLGTIAFSSKRMTLSVMGDHALDHLHSPVFFVGPALEGERAPIDFPWHLLDLNLPKLFFSMGTVNAQRAAPLYSRVIAALSELNVQVIAAAPPKYFINAPHHWIIRERVPQLELLAHMDAVFCHGGHNTTMEALCFGLPLVIAPIRDDQPVIAEQVKAIGAGLRVHFTRAKPESLRLAVEKVLFSAEIKRQAQAIRKEFARHSESDFCQDSNCKPVQIPAQLGAYQGSVIISKILEEIKS